MATIGALRVFGEEPNRVAAVRRGVLIEG